LNIKSKYPNINRRVAPPHSWYIIAREWKIIIGSAASGPRDVLTWLTMLPDWKILKEVSCPSTAPETVTHEDKSINVRKPTLATANA